MVTFLILLVVGIIITITLSIVLSTSPTAKLILQIVYVVGIVVLGYFLVESIMKPIRFNKELDKREEATINRLKDIRTIQVAYKERYGKYTGDFDTLIDFVKLDSFELTSEKLVGEWIADEITKSEAIELGIIEITKTYRPVKDSLFSDDYDIEAIRFVPFTNNTVELGLGASELETVSKVKVQVFESYALFDDLMNGMDKQLTINHIDEKYQITNFKGIKVGSLVEATNNAGNWGEN